MSDIFVSYSRADATRVGRLVRALKGAGLSLWWDRGIPGGENWREQIQIALDAARCVIVVWTHASVGEAGGFVRDEATQAMRRGVMVPVMLDKVDLPLGFGEIQAIDLTRWRGRRRDPFFIDLCTAVTAKLEGRAVPPAKGPLKRLLRRARYGSLASAMVLCALAFGFDLYDAQEHACGVSLLQPQVSDVCGKFGLGDRPTRSERIAWEGRELGSCPALRAHIERFPQGVYRDEAANLLTARRVTQVETWKPVVHRLRLFVSQDNSPSIDEAAARSATLARAEAAAERLCDGFAATASFHLTLAEPSPQIWDCEVGSRGVVCGFDGEALCELEERRDQEMESCGR